MHGCLQVWAQIGDRKYHHFLAVISKFCVGRIWDGAFSQFVKIYNTHDSFEGKSASIVRAPRAAACKPVETIILYIHMIFLSFTQDPFINGSNRRTIQLC